MNLRRAPAATANSLDRHNAPDTHVHGNWLVLVQIVLGVLAVFALIVFIASLPVYSLQLQTVCRTTSCAVGQLTPATVQALHRLGISIDGYALFRLISTIVSAVVSFAVAGVLVWRRSDEWMALLVAFMLVMLGVVGITDTVSGSASFWHVPAQLVSVLAYPTYFLVFMVFPDGRFVPHWSRWLVITFLALSVWYDFSPDTFNGNVWLSLFGTLLFVGLIISLPATQIYRYRYVSTSIQLQQTKWVVFGLAVGTALEFVPYLLTLFLPPFNQPGSLYPLLFNPDAGGSPLQLLLPLSFGVAILRYRLWDIDILINRTLVYGSLTAILGLVYFASVIALQALLSVLTGQFSSGPQTPVVIVASTLGIFALFHPLRRRLQAIIDRRFYRSKYDAARTLAAFSASLRDEVDLNQLREQLLAVVQETMQPSHISLWLRDPEQSRERNTRLLPRIDQEESAPP